MSEQSTQIQVNFPTASKLFSPGVSILLVLMLAGFLLFTFAGDFAISSLALNPRGILHGQIWQIITYFIVNNAMGFVFNGLAVLFLGSIIERQWRTISFLILWLVVVVICGLLWVLIGIISGRDMIGMGGQAGVYGLIAAFGVLYRGRRFFAMVATLHAEHIALLFIVIGVILSISQPINLIWVAGAPVAYLYIKLIWQKQARTEYVSPEPSGDRGSGFVDLD